MNVPYPAQAPITDRKIIRNARLTIELESPTHGQRAITEMAESLGGFVVTSEFQHQGGSGETVTVVVRVPAAQFNAALAKVRAIGNRILQEKVSGQDVTEEYIDLEARIRTKKALEAQFLEIMKQARRIPDALEVQRQLAEVRTEIEQLEGRRRFLDNQSALSTIEIVLQTPAPLVTATTSGFGQSIKQAFSEGVDVAIAIFAGLIRVIIGSIPILVLVLLPVYLIVRFVRGRVKLIKKSQPASEAQPSGRSDLRPGV